MRHLVEFPAVLQGFFTDRLIRQLRVSTHTIASYRDTFRLLLRYLEREQRKRPSDLTFADLDAKCILRFLDHLERQRGNGASTRNARLAAIHSLFTYAALEAPQHMVTIQQVLAIPMKRTSHRSIDFLDDREADALRRAPDERTQIGRRDQALLTTALETGLRAAELVGLRRKDLVLGRGSHVRCEGKGRKERCVPIRAATAALLRSWVEEIAPKPDDPLFPSSLGVPLGRDGLEYALAKHVARACRRCPSLKRKRVTAHVLRHTVAMNLLRAGVDVSVIALWLGHASIQTTMKYLHSDLELKRRMMKKAAGPKLRFGKYQAGDRLLNFLQDLSECRAPAGWPEGMAPRAGIVKGPA
jgi:integrase/recombinase XerD